MKPLIKKNHPATATEIVLGKDPYVDYLYGCFRLHNPKGDAFTPERDVEIVFRSGKKIRVRVPPEMKVALPDNAKVVNAERFQLEKIGKHHDTMHLLTMRAGWNQTDQDIRRMIGLDPKGSFVAKLVGPDYDFPLATSSVLPLGRHNTWIGMILVHPEARRQGIANYMMQMCLKYAIDNGKVINGLDATPMGNTVYGAVGYVDAYRIWRSFYPLAEFADQTYDPHRVRAMAESDLDETIRYDAANYLEREAIMRGLFADGYPEGCFIYRHASGAIQGYCFTRPGRIRPFVGPFIADSDDIARQLLTAASQRLLKDHPGGTAFIDTPESKFQDPGVYVKRVFDQEKKPTQHRLIKAITPVRDFTRMYQLVHYTEAEALVDQFKQAEALDESTPRVRDFRETIYRSVNNYTETLGFMTYERDTLQRKFWGITGPEKG